MSNAELLLSIFASVHSASPCGVALLWPLVALHLGVCRNLAKGVSEESEAANV